ncbi:serine/threonine protein kinase with two-component sensor domain [Nostoc carneum NIES-2107]|nr:serine/threonine protein kinase with two-component sensor domain [Nostoc carneum NIES-2107]
MIEDFGGISLQVWTARDTQLSLQEFLENAIAFCNPLDVAYRQCILHKNIQTSNILIEFSSHQFVDKR